MGKNDLWKIPVGYQNHNISLGDSYLEIQEKLGNFKLDPNGQISDNFKEYFTIETPFQIENLKLNPIIFLKFNNDELVYFVTVYTIDETEKQINFETLIKNLSKKELTEIEGLLGSGKNSIVDNEDLWLRSIKIDTTSGVFPKIEYRVQAIP